MTPVYNNNKKIINTFLAVLALAYILPIGGSFLGIYFTIKPEGEGLRFFLKIMFSILFISGMIWWVLNSFEKPPKDKGKFFYQLSISGVYKDWGKNVLPLAMGLCKIHPFRDSYFKIEYIPVSNESITLFNKQTNGEDGEVFDLVTPEKQVPVVCKYKLVACITDTFLFLSQDQAKKDQNLEVIAFKGVAEAINAKAKSNEVSRKQIQKIEEESLRLIHDRAVLIGITALEIDINSIEKTSAEQKAQKEGETEKIKAEQVGHANVIKAKKEAEVVVITAEADALADNIRAEQLNRSQTEFKKKNDGLTDQEAATLALAASGQKINVTLLAGNTPTVLGTVLQGTDQQDGGASTQTM